MVVRSYHSSLTASRIRHTNDTVCMIWVLRSVICTFVDPARPAVSWVRPMMHPHRGNVSARIPGSWRRGCQHTHKLALTHLTLAIPGTAARTWLLLLHGRQLVRLLPQSEAQSAPPPRHTDGAPATTAARAAATPDLMLPDFTAQPQLRGALVFERVLVAGDVLFVPEGWALQTISLEWSCVLRGSYVDEHTATVTAVAGVDVGAAVGGPASPAGAEGPPALATADAAAQSRRDVLQADEVRLHLTLLDAVLDDNIHLDDAVIS